MEELNENGVNNFFVMLKGLAISVCMSLIMILILSIVISFSNISENVIMPTVVFISAFSILIGAFLVAKKINQKGIIYGSMLGIIYMAILYITSSIINFNFSLNLNSIVMIAFGVIGGAIGGILGVNLK